MAAELPVNKRIYIYMLYILKKKDAEGQSDIHENLKPRASNIYGNICVYIYILILIFVIICVTCDFWKQIKWKQSKTKRVVDTLAPLYCITNWPPSSRAFHLSMLVASQRVSPARLCPVDSASPQQFPTLEDRLHLIQRCEDIVTKFGFDMFWLSPYSPSSGFELWVALLVILVACWTTSGCGMEIHRLDEDTKTTPWLVVSTHLPQQKRQVWSSSQVGCKTAHRFVQTYGK